MLPVITLASKKSMIMQYMTALNASKKENDTKYRFEIFCGCTVIVTLQSAKTTLLAWHYFWQEEIGSDTFFSRTQGSRTNILAKFRNLWLTHCPPKFSKMCKRFCLGFLQNCMFCGNYVIILLPKEKILLNYWR